jgi:hypothetical protein
VRRTRLVCCAVLALVLAPAGAQARPDGVDHLVRITQAFQRAHHAALPAARDAAAAKRATANACRDDVADATPDAARTLEANYFIWAEQGLDEHLAPPRRAWIAALHDDRGVMALPVLAKAVRLWRVVDAEARAIEHAVTDFCADVRAWAAAGWKKTATPASAIEVARRLARIYPDSDRLDAATDKAARYLRGQGTGRSVRRMLIDGGDVGDAATLPADDPLLKALRGRQRGG